MRKEINKNRKKDEKDSSFIDIVVVATSLWRSSDKQRQDVGVELEKGNPDKADTHPRSLIPITCVYADGMVQLTLIGEVGEYTLTVTNQSTGEQWSVENSLVLQTSTASGIYWVQIETEDGSMYYGTYTL